MKTEINPHYRQGDVLIERVDTLPSAALTARPRQGGRLILAAGSVTGHHHAIASVEADLFEAAGEPGVTYLVARGSVALSHEEHSTITLPTGVYRVSIQKEYTPQAIRNVAD